MSDSFRKHINKFISVTPDEFNGILAFTSRVTAKKRETLLVKGKVSNTNYFVVKGCLRMFFVNDKGTEQTVQFAIENWWLSDYTSFEGRKPSGYFIQAVEKSELLALTYQDQEKMLKKFPSMERYFRLIHQRAHAAAQHRIRMLYDLSREELYRKFAAQYPEFVNRIPQYLLASFLNLTPQYLSEIRAKRNS